MQNIAAANESVRPSKNAARPAPLAALDALAVAARDGDRRALQQLLAQVRARIRPLVRHKVGLLGAGVLSMADVEDVVQEVVLAAWRFDVPRFDPARGSFSTFLSRRLAWHVVDAVRSRARHVHADIDAPGFEAPSATDAETLLATAALEQSLTLLVPQLELALAELSPDERYVVRRYDLEGARIADVAAELGKNPSKACRARQRALKRLSARLEALAA
ncbi:MAG: sigma-70 family RNA polymerase sigma factor [Deltaproteobacteria bacterium]|nr:sigma-70 family RNA polymerase sigma factor [Deltaproteobacteria bacterium]